MTFDISKSREHFPALQQDQVFLDNAGGSQALGDVIDSLVKIGIESRSELMYV
jgi:selenocysteine lyase/cysteine desulfurase